MKRLIRVCSVCEGTGDDYDLQSECGACEGRGQLGENVRIVSLKQSNKHVPANALAVVAEGQGKWFDSNQCTSNIYCSPSNGPAPTPFIPAAGYTGGCVNQIPQGTGPNARIGRRIRMTRFRLRGNIAARLDVSTVTSQPFRLLVIYDRAPNQQAALPAWTDILTQQAASALPNKNNEKRFELLYDQQRYVWSCNVTFGSAGAYNVNDPVFCLDLDIKLNHLTYWVSSDTTGIFTKMMVGALYVYQCSDTGIVLPDYPYCVYSTRVEYEDV